jgi:hypothetical protein
LPNVTLLLKGLSGEISGTLTSGIYMVTGDIIVPAGDSLIIEPGTFLRFKQDCSFIIRGSIYANGTVNDSIVFERFDVDNTWKGIRLVNTEYSDNSEFTYVQVKNSSMGGMYITSNCSINHSTICNNTGDFGGGIGIFDANNYNIVITNTEFFQNTGNEGGGIYISLGSDEISLCLPTVIANCLIYENAANAGIGIYFNLWYYVRVCPPSITNCTFVNNTNIDTIQGSGAVLECQACMPNFINNIISNNIGYGVKLNYNSQYFGFNNTFNNSLGNYINPPSNVGNNVTTNVNGDPCDAYHNMQLDPMFEDENNRNFRLQVGSPCIDVGLNDSVFCDLDFDEHIRIWDGNNFGNAFVDMGIFEHGSIHNINNQNITNDYFICYPNPTSGVINLKFNENNIERVMIYDIRSKVVFDKIEIQQFETIDASNYEKGIYIITIQNDKGISTMKLIKN